MKKVIGLDFEAAPISEGINTWNHYHYKALSVGAWIYGSKSTFYSTIKPLGPYVLTKWNKKFTPELTTEKLNSSKSSCEVLNDLLAFFQKECKDGCNVVTYGELDLVQFMKLMIMCKPKTPIKINKFDPYFYKPSNVPFTLTFVDLYKFSLYEKPYNTELKLKNQWLSIFPNETYEEHNALQDAKAVAEVAVFKYNIDYLD